MKLCLLGMEKYSPVIFKFFPKIPRESRRLYVSALAFTMTIAGFFQVKSTDSFGDFINQQLFYPLVFSAKSKLVTENLDPRLKIFAFDDSTVAYKKSTDLPLPEWADVFESLSRQRKVTVLIDKLFDAHPTEESVQKFSEKMASLQNIKIGAITFAHPDRIRFRTEIDSQLVDAVQKTVFKDPIDNPNTPFDYSNMTLYGAEAAVLKNFHAFGFANYSGDGFIAPFAELTNKQIVAHASLSIFEGIEISDKNLTISGQEIPTDTNGKVLINFFEPSIYRKRALSMAAVVARVQKDLDISAVKPGDVVLILPAMFTGHTDFANSPYGLIPGGFHLAAVINSVLTKNWITVIDDPGFFALIAACLGITLGLIFKPAAGILAVLISSLLIICVSTLLFVYFQIAIVFVIPVGALLIGGLCGITLKIHSTALEEARKNRELEVASLVQKSFFPKATESNLEKSSCRSIGVSEPASECGGDWWGSIRKNNYTYHFIADAIGHGVPAALITSVAYTASKAMELELGRAMETLLPSDILTVVNRVLVSLGASLRQMTFFIVRIDELSGECVFANAGNPPALWVKKSLINIDGKSQTRPEQLTARGNILGDYAASKYENYSIKLEDGDKIVMFTDGLFENRTADERSQLGKPWLRSTIQRHAGRPLEDFSESVWRSYKFAIGSTRPDDDATLLVIEFDRKNIKTV